MAAPGQDRAIAQQVNQKLAMKGIRSPCKIDVKAKNGDVTLTGSIQFDYQRATVVQAASSASGVRRVVDQLTIKPPAKRT